MPPSDNHLIAEILEKMIDSQISNTEALTSLKDSVDKLNFVTLDINDHFKNGFRSEIKEHVTKQINYVLDKSKTAHSEQQLLEENICSRMEQLILEVRSFKKIGFWVKTFGALLGSMAVVVAAIAGIIAKMG